MITKKHGFLITLLKTIPISVWVLLGFILFGLNMYGVFGLKNEILGYITLIIMVSPIIGIIMWGIVYCILCGIDLIRAVNKIRYFPLTKEEFDNLTNKMTLLDCLSWLYKIMVFGGFENTNHILPILKRKEYSIYILQYCIWAYEKYKNFPQNKKVTHDIFDTHLLFILLEYEMPLIKFQTTGIKCNLDIFNNNDDCALSIISRELSKLII